MTRTTREAEAPGAQNLPARIVNAAIAIAEERGRWSAVRLHDVAGRLGVPTSQVLDHFRDLDSVADAWFMRALKAMVAQKPPDFLELPEWHRIELCFNAWLDALAPHRRMTAQMLRGKPMEVRETRDDSVGQERTRRFLRRELRPLA